MKSKKNVILVWALLCCVPAVSFFLFRDKNDALGSYIPKTSTSWPVQLENRQYQVALEPVKEPLRQGKQTLTLSIHAADGKPATVMPVIDIVMPMDNEMMTAPVETQKLAAPDTYQIQTFFSMAGEWQLLVKPKASDKPIQLDFFVEM